MNSTDDLVICCRVGAEQALTEMRAMMSKLKLTVHETKTRVCYLPEEKFDFLGYTFGRCYSMKRGCVSLGASTFEATSAAHLSRDQRRDRARYRQLDPKAMVEKLNRMLIGWANYFLYKSSARQKPTVQ